MCKYIVKLKKKKSQNHTNKKIVKYQINIGNHYPNYIAQLQDIIIKKKASFKVTVKQIKYLDIKLQNLCKTSLSKTLKNYKKQQMTLQNGKE